MTENNPLISVVLSNYNGEEYLAPALDSVLAQTFDDFEVILIDDGSSDDSVRILNSYAKSHQNMRVIALTENRGQANGFNVGIEAAHGKLISFMDSDDLWYPEKLEVVAELHKQNPDAVLLQHNLFVRYGDKPSKTCFRRELLSGNLLDFMKWTDRVPDFSPTAGLTFLKTVLEKVGPIPLEFKTCADGYLTRTSLCFGPVSSTNRCLGEYRIHGSNATADNPEWSMSQYIDGLLLPKLQQFYTEHKIDFDYTTYKRRKRDNSLQTHLRLRVVARNFYLAMTRSFLLKISRIPVFSNLWRLYPVRLQERLNAKRLAGMRGKHGLKTAFIIGMGPSLKVEDLNKLKDEITFACNKIYLCFGETDWRPTYYSVMDILVAENNKKEISQLRLPRIFSRSVQEAFPNEKDIIWISERSPPFDRNGQRYIKVANDVRYGAYGGFTVVFFQIQLAIYMGITEIYLLGLDFSFDLSAATGEKSKSGDVLVSNGEVNHFHKDYRKKGETWTVPQLEMQKMAFQAALDYANENGIRIYNASRQTELEVFERVNLDDILE